MDKQNNCITIRYDITTYGYAYYNEEDSAKIRSYMEETGCSVEEAIWELVDAGAIEDYPENIGIDHDTCLTYTEE